MFINFNPLCKVSVMQAIADLVMAITKKEKLN